MSMKKNIFKVFVVLVLGSVCQATIIDDYMAVCSDAIGHWQFEGSDPQLVVDTTSNGNDLYFGNSTGVDGEDGSRTSDGLLGNAMYCVRAAGMASSVTDNDGLDFAPDDAFSIALWVKNEYRTGNSTLVSKQESSGYYRGYSLVWQSDDTIQFLLRSQNLVGDRLWVRMTTGVGEIVAADDQWVHVAMTYNGNLSSSGFKLYLNGAQVDPSLLYDYDDEPGLDDTDDTTNNIAFCLGGRNTSSIFGGYMDEAAVWGRVLSSAEVTTLAAIPEPATIAILGLGCFAALLRRKR